MTENPDGLPEGCGQAVLDRQQDELTFAVPDLGPHTAFLAAQLAATFSRFLGSHAILRERYE